MGGILPGKLNAKLKHFVITYGGKIFKRIQVLMGRYSLVGDKPFFSPTQFPWCTELEANWLTIHQGLDEVLRHRDEIPNSQDISRDQAYLAKEDKWKTFFFFGYGLDAPGNCARCPRTAKLLKTVPGAKTAFFSILSAHSHIPEHCGPYKGGNSVPPWADSSEAGNGVSHSSGRHNCPLGRRKKACSSTTFFPTKSGTTLMDQGSFYLWTFCDRFHIL